jgi:hypothetical protein
MRRLALLVGGFLAVLALGAGGMLALADPDEPTAPPETAAVRLSVHPAPPPVRYEHTVGRIPPNGLVALRAKPGGRIVETVGEKTEFGSPETVSPTGQRRGDWIAVRHTSLGNAGTAWVKIAELEFRPRAFRLDVDLSRRELLVVRDGVERRIPVAVGAPDTPTPPGEYYVTDKLRGSDFGDFYGCCILALSGTQPNLPQGWSGGDRLAIHGSPTPTWGKNVSNGCFHAPEPDLRWLIEHVPLGTVVSVHA